MAVLGRRGVGRGAVAAALANSGIAVAAGEAEADVRVLVIAETLKPEDRALLRGSSGGSGVGIVVLNKADLSGADPGGPLVRAHRRAAELAVVAGRPVVPMIAHLATIGLDDANVGALHVLAAHPADLTSTDSFVAGVHQLPVEVRKGLLDKLDRFGLAYALAALAAGGTASTVTRQLREVSQVDSLVQRLKAALAPFRYHRARGAMLELRALAAQSGDDQLDTFLNSDAVVVALMSAAADVVLAAGFTLDSDRHGDQHGQCDAQSGPQLRRAERWNGYARGPVNLLHQRCATDIVRGSLRLHTSVR
ncbi:MAG: hypothetical protein AB7G47_15580 [Mycolicibacterium sp.]|uniref:hypothetical protein n=1 Tax=Mycolicibacterium sp. TaxID=2320850 RepID=UPI003D14E7B6